MGGILTKMPPMGGKSPLGGLKGSTACLSAGLDAEPSTIPCIYLYFQMFLILLKRMASIC